MFETVTVEKLFSLFTDYLQNGIAAAEAAEYLTADRKLGMVVSPSLHYIEVFAEGKPVLKHFFHRQDNIEWDYYTKPETVLKSTEAMFYFAAIESIYHKEIERRKEYVLQKKNKFNK